MNGLPQVCRCGIRPEVLRGEHSGLWHVECQKRTPCCVGPLRESRQEAIDAWNGKVQLVIEGSEPCDD